MSVLRREYDASSVHGTIPSRHTGDDVLCRSLALLELLGNRRRMSYHAMHHGYRPFRSTKPRARCLSRAATNGRASGRLDATRSSHALETRRRGALA